MRNRKLFWSVLVMTLMGLLLVGCGRTETISEVPDDNILEPTEIKAAPTEPVEPAAPPTGTTIPPTETAVPPTDTPEIIFISAAEESITIGEFSFRIVEIAYDETAMGMAPAGMGAGDQIVWVEFELVSGDQAGFEKLQITLKDNAGKSSDAIILASDGMMQMLASVTMMAASGNFAPKAENIAWAYVFPISVGELYLEFPGGEVVELTPVLP